MAGAFEISRYVNAYEGLDLVRLLVLKSNLTNPEFMLIDNLMACLPSSEKSGSLSPTQETNSFLALRTLANLFATKAGEKLLVNCYAEIFARVRGLVNLSSKTNLHVAYATFIFKLI